MELPIPLAAPINDRLPPFVATDIPRRVTVTRLLVLNVLVTLFAITFTVWTVYYAYSLMWMRLRYSNVFLGLGLALYYLDVVRRRYKAEAEAEAEAEASVDAGADAGADARTDSTSVSGSRQTPGVVSSLGSTWGEQVARLRAAYDRIDPYVALSFAALALLATAYVELNFERLHEDVHLMGHTQVDLIVGALLIVLVIDATRRAFGNIIAGVTVVSIAYAHVLFATILPGVLRHTGYGWERIARQGAIDLTGVYHDTLMGIGSTWVAIFIMFAGIAKAYGLMDFVLDVGRELGKTLRTGVVQIAVIASMVMGSITGSAAANTATTGSFTIPMMQDQGVRDDFSAAIESVASAGGQMLPPVMGVAAFLMADLLGESYLTIVQAGVIPAALFYLSVGIGIHFAILKFGWTTPNRGSFDWRLLLQGIHFAVPLGVLIVTLVVLRYTPLYAGLYSIVTIFLVGSLKLVAVDILEARKMNAEYSSIGYRFYWVFRECYRVIEQIALGLRRGGLEMAPLVGVLAAMGIIIEMLTFTGLAPRVSTGILGLGGGLLVVVLVLAMIASILFGLGMPTPAAYVLVVVLVVPGVTEMGVPDITAHMFVFYFAMLSAITPPVAISVAIGSRIAGTDFVRSCIQALRIGAPGFIIPFAFVTNNSLITWSQETLLAFPVVLAGTVALIVATIGFDGARDLSYPARGLYAIAAFGAMFGSVVSVAIQVVAAAAIVGALLYAKVVLGYDIDADAGADAGTQTEAETETTSD
ncbi:TRAP transporter permease [Natrialba sp. SSL1]|uniref:TRAP transporter permease n=1 Tax=Natrialba sp. SSL1 TaxID=1869245 RepID=UPI0008F8C60A|nr:TRAP transporter fused permease subunit [Natrialba sp. SSL1]OIB57613.1 C4-dicarboxylate ABC transporter permease [Natrialba sp. SSL1]